MADLYQQLLDATLIHLRTLRTQGRRFVEVSPEVLAGLTTPSPAGPDRASFGRPPGSKPVVVSVEATIQSTLSAPMNRSSPPAATVSLATLTTRAQTRTPEERTAAMQSFRHRVLTCQKCEPLVKARTQVVFGVGDANAQLLFVGEAPGADEDVQGEPFVGKAGQLLTRIIQTMGLSRETVFIANILKCRPDTPGQSSGNRKPTPSEMATCLPYLLEQIDIVQPRVIVALGATAVEGLFGKSEGITRLRGRWLSFRDTPVMPTYHPAYLLRNQALSEKRKVWEDMLAVMEKLGMSISEKQRSFFLKP